MSLLLKDPEALLDYSVDWGADYLTGDVLTESGWTVSPAEAGGVSIVSSRFDLLVSTVQVGGGVAGRIYRLTNHVVTAEGREDSRSILLRVEKR
ncbi:MAG TPA: hypothetical protein VFO12_09295 [Sphingomicrobium sp.]|nr:hypothetical protein [Sphingomicrobium sp.]